MKNKKLLSAMIAASVVTFSQLSWADNTGCGLGTVLFKGTSSVVTDVLAVTTNGTSGNQTFGITSGTSGCEYGATIAAGKRAKLFSFADKNMEEVALDVSKGGGEYLNSVADIIGIKEADKAYFFTLSQKNFSTVFSGENVNTAEVVDNFAKLVNRDKVLRSYEI